MVATVDNQVVRLACVIEYGQGCGSNSDSEAHGCDRILQMVVPVPVAPILVILLVTMMFKRCVGLWWNDENYLKKVIQKKKDHENNGEMRLEEEMKETSRRREGEII